MTGGCDTLPYYKSYPKLLKCTLFYSRFGCNDSVYLSSLKVHIRGQEELLEGEIIIDSSTIILEGQIGCANITVNRKRDCPQNANK